MLTELSIKNFAIIEGISISFENGLTVLSGETGAGKSIIIDAIGLLVGGRGSSEFVRYDTAKAEIEGLFYLEGLDHPFYERCDYFGIEVEEEEMVILKREITANGKSICRVNGKLVTLAALKEIGKTLVDIHGQHEHQDLMTVERHLSFLDQFGGEDIESIRQQYEEQYTHYHTLKGELKKLTENEQQMAHRLDLIQFQLDEIKSAALTPNEDIELQEERMKISNFEKLYKSLQEAYTSLNSDQHGLDHVRAAMYSVESVTSINGGLQPLSDTITNAFYHLEEATFALREQIDALEYDPQRLEFIESRLNEIHKLKRKYGSDVEEILAYSEKIELEISTIENKDVHIEKFKKELAVAQEQLMLIGQQLSALRHTLAEQLTDSIHQELQELHMDKTEFCVKFQLIQGNEFDPIIEEQHVKFTKEGMENIEFYISTNPGEPLKPLAKVASGGELSRIILALKSIFSKHQGITSIIFDEVDTGVSGRVAQAIAEKIYKVSVHSQVLCITHLPQVAAMADTHLYIAKEIEGERTRTSVTALPLEERAEEIARMISGIEITAVTLQHANELIEQAKELKMSMGAI